jgi:hypothetical protein
LRTRRANASNTASGFRANASGENSANVAIGGDLDGDGFGALASGDGGAKTAVGADSEASGDASSAFGFSSEARADSF